MRKIYVSDSGNDTNDGCTDKTPIRSWERFINLCEGNDEVITGDGCVHVVDAFAARAGTLDDAELGKPDLTICDFERAELGLFCRRSTPRKRSNRRHLHARLDWFLANIRERRCDEMQKGALSYGCDFAVRYGTSRGATRSI